MSTFARVLRPFFHLVIGAGLAWLAIAFILAEPNPMAWMPEHRVFAVGVVVMIVAVGAGWGGIDRAGTGREGL